MNNLEQLLKLKMDSYKIDKKLGLEDYGSLYVELEELMDMAYKLGAADGTLKTLKEYNQ